MNRREEILKLLKEIDNLTYLTLEQEDKYEIRRLVERIKELF